MIHLKDKSACCGCTACVSICPKKCISMYEDSEGFLYPSVDTSLCIDCGLCEKVCPVINQADSKRTDKVYAAINPDENIRRMSSSGGIFSMLAENIIAQNGVVFGVRFDDNWEVIHDSCETIEGLSVFRGSKYVQSRIGDCYLRAEKYLKGGRKVLFSGTPCQIAGLHNYLRKEYDNLLTVDVVCHGVPSPAVWRAYLKELKTRPQGVAGKNTVLSSLNEIPLIKDISFRDKTDGWKKYGFAVWGCADQGEAHKNSVLPSNCHIDFREYHRDNLFMQAFLYDIILRPSCYDCPAKSGKSCSDITLADYWGVENHHPEIDDNKGTSLVLINTDKGQQAFDSLSCKSVVSSYEKALLGNPSIESSVNVPAARKHYLKSLQKTSNPIESARFALSKVKFTPSVWDKLKFNINRLIK